MSGINWLRSLAVFCATGMISYFILKHYLGGDWSLVIAASLALFSLFASSMLFRTVLREAVKYPSKTSEIAESPRNKKDWDVNSRR